MHKEQLFWRLWCKWGKRRRLTVAEVKPTKKQLLREFVWRELPIQRLKIKSNELEI
jgi:hypothetical protein